MRLAFALLLLTGLALRLSLALGPLDNIDGVLLPDDAYLFADIARSIANGDGPLYGQEFTNGFQPLFAFVLAPVFWIWPGNDAPVHAALTIASLFDVLAVWILAHVLRHACGGSRLPGLVLAAAWLANHSVLRNTLNGMETSLACCGLAFVLWTHRRLLIDRAVAFGPIQAFAIGASIGIAMLARVDSILIVLPLWLTILWRASRGQLTTTPGLVRSLPFYALGAGLAFLPWVIYSYAYTGEVYPVSGKAVRFQADAHYEMFPPDVQVLGMTLTGEFGTTWIHLRRAAGELVRGNYVLLAAAAAFGIVALVRRRRPLAAGSGACLGALVLHVLVLYLAYSLYIHGTWFFHRYLYPAFLPSALALGLTFHAATSGLVARAQHVVTTATCLVLVAASAMTPQFREFAWTERDGNFGYRRLGIWVRDRFDEGTKIGAKQSGAISYYADHCEVVNLDGVVNHAAFEALQDRRMLAYCATLELESYVLWDWGKDFLDYFSETPRAHELVEVETVPDVHSWGDVGTNVWRIYELR